MFEKFRRFRFNIVNLIPQIHSMIAHYLDEQSNVYRKLERMEKNYTAMSYDVVELRNMVSAMRADISSLTLEMAMKPSMGEQPFVKVSVPLNDYVMQGDH